MRRCLLVLLATIALCLPPPARASDKINLVIATTGFQYLAPLAAIQLGFFKDEALDVEITYTSGAKALAAVSMGRP